MLLRNIFILSTIALAALLSPALTAEAAAQRGHGGGHGGGGYHGGGYGGYHGGYGGYYGGYGGYHHGYYGGYGYPGIYGGYGLYRPYYRGYYGNSGYIYPSTGYIDDGSNITQSGYYAPPEPDNTAMIHVFVPADAKVWIDGEATSKTGEERMFASPPLTPGKNFTYMVKARWMVNGKAVEKTQKVRVRANETSNVTFGE